MLRQHPAHAPALHILPPQLPAESGLPWPVSIPAGQATVRDPANEEDTYVTNQAAFMASMRTNQPVFSDQVASFLAADTWGCLYNGE